MLKVNFKVPKQDSKQGQVKKQPVSTFWKKFFFFKMHFVYFALAYVAFFVLTVLISVSFVSASSSSGVDSFTVGQIWTITLNQGFLSVEYTNYQLVLFVFITLIVIFLIFGFAYFLVDLKRNRQKKVFRSINWKLTYFIIILLVLIAWTIFVLVELTSIFKNYQWTLSSKPINLGGLWTLSTSTLRVSRTSLNSVIIALCWIWFGLFSISFFPLGYTGREQQKK